MRTAQVREPAALAAACRVAGGFDYTSDDPIVLQETNNTVVWLQPHAVIAKVGKWSDSEAALVREHNVGAALAVLDAPVAHPIPEIGPARDAETGFTVTLWERLDHDAEQEAPPEAIGSSLRKLHDALMRYDEELPSFYANIDRAKRALADDGVMHALAPGDRALLRRAFDHLRQEVEDGDLLRRPLHGEAHSGNLLVTPEGLRWIDFEDACVGPLEWDLAFLPERAVDVFPGS